MRAPHLYILVTLMKSKEVFRRYKKVLYFSFYNLKLLVHIERGLICGVKKFYKQQEKTCGDCSFADSLSFIPTNCILF